MLKHALPAAKKIGQFKQRARRLGVPVIYVNDNFGKWRSDFRNQVAHCLGDGVRGEPIARLLAPDDEDYFVLKPKHSGFYSTVLDTLPAYLKTQNLILTGLTGDLCVFFTANDAYLRDFRLFIPAELTRGLDRIMELAAEMSVAIMCSESHPLTRHARQPRANCHRVGLLAPRLRARGANIIHILPDGQTLEIDESVVPSIW